MKTVLGVLICVIGIVVSSMTSATAATRPTGTIAFSNVSCSVRLGNVHVDPNPAYVRVIMTTKCHMNTSPYYAVRVQGIAQTLTMWGHDSYGEWKRINSCTKSINEASSIRLLCRAHTAKMLANYKVYATSCAEYRYNTKCKDVFRYTDQV